MARTLPSAIPPTMYRHFALVTVLLTASVAMFADGENREAAAAQIEQPEVPASAQEGLTAPRKPATSTRTLNRHDRYKLRGGADGFDPSFGQPMDKAVGSLASYATRLAAPAAAQTGYSDAYLASLDPRERQLLLDGLAQEGMMSPGERESRSAALIAASKARSGAPMVSD